MTIGGWVGGRAYSNTSYNTVVKYTPEKDGPAASESIFFGREEWGNHLGFVYDIEPELPPEIPRDYNRVLIPKEVGGEPYTVSFLRGIVEERFSDVEIFSHLSPSDDIKAHKTIFSTAPTTSYWCGISNGKTLRAVYPMENKNPSLLEVLTLYTARIKAYNMRLTSNPVWCEEQVNGKRVWVKIVDNEIAIGASATIRPYKAYHVVRPIEYEYEMIEK